MHQLVIERIVTGLADIGLHARQIGQMHVDAGEFLPGEIFRHRHRHEFLVLRQGRQHALFLRIGQRDHFADRVQRLLDAFRGLLRHQQHAIIAPVVGKLDAETVEDAAARRGQQPLIDAVVLGLGHVLIAVADLELIKAAGQNREDRVMPPPNPSERRVKVV